MSGPAPLLRLVERRHPAHASPGYLIRPTLCAGRKHRAVMTSVDQNSLRKLVEGQLIRMEGNTFQDCIDRLGLELYPGDYQPVRAAGPKGDTKNDGYCPKARVFFAAHATRGERIDKTKAKIRSDLEGCLQEHREVRVWRFLTNDTLAGEVDQFIDNELRPLYLSVTIEV